MVDLLDSRGEGIRAANRLVGRRDQIVERFEYDLARMGSILLASPQIRQQCVDQAENVIMDVCAALREVSALFTSRVGGADSVNLSLATDIGIDRAASGIHPVESLRAGSVLFEAVLAGVREAVADEPNAAVLAAVATRSLHHSLMDRIRTAATSYSSFLLSSTAEAHVGERRRIAREMHDRLGSNISAAARAIELAQVQLRGDRTDLALVEQRLAQGGESMREALESIRQLAQDLHLHTKTEGLEKAVLRCIEGIQPPCTETILEVNGDEDWAPPPVLDELFLVLREALRNAFTHGRPRKVMVRVEIAPHELRASVNDDGVGFTQDSPARSGLGLVSMRERIALLGGMVNIFSLPGRGTSADNASC
jgi:signal transduction histidine kinase